MIKICARCGESFEAVAHARNVKYCPDCRPIVNRERCLERNRRLANERRIAFHYYYLENREQILERMRINYAKKNQKLKEARS